MTYDEMTNEELAALCGEYGLEVRSGKNYHGRLVTALNKYDESAVEEEEIEELVEEVAEIEEIEVIEDEPEIEEEEEEDIEEEEEVFVEDNFAPEPVSEVPAETVYTELYRPKHSSHQTSQIYTY